MVDNLGTAAPSLIESRALWFNGPGQATLKTALTPRPQAHEILVRALVSGISRGTESLVFKGLVPESEHTRMRCPFQEGAFPFPVKYGYAMVGIVEDGPDELIGATVLALYPHQTRFVIPRDAAIPLPPGVTAERAVLAPQMETALNALWDAAPRPGDRIAVVGGGVIGCLVAYLCARIPGCAVTLIDPDERRRSIATSFGAAFARPDESLPAHNDLVFHTSASAGGLETALRLAGFEASIIELSWYGASFVPVPLGAAFHSQRLTLRSSQVGTIALERRARWDHTRRLALALSLTADPRLDILLDKAIPFDDLPMALPEILGRTGALSVRVTYPGN